MYCRQSTAASTHRPETTPDPGMNKYGHKASLNSPGTFFRKLWNRGEDNQFVFVSGLVGWFVGFYYVDIKHEIVLTSKFVLILEETSMSSLVFLKVLHVWYICPFQITVPYPLPF